MIETTFDIPTLAGDIVDIVLQDPAQTRSELLVRITGCMQRAIDQKLVPRNYSVYASKKKRQKWIKALQRNDVEIDYWKEVIKKVSGDNNIELYYDDLNRLFEEKGFKVSSKAGSKILCYYCEREIDAARYGGDNLIYSTRDHMFPKSKGGKDSHTNIVNACNQCNQLKADMTIPQFIATLKKYKTDHPNDIFLIMIKNAEKLLTE